jgi:predicted GIY-YIG superfamily endonuclease
MKKVWTSETLIELAKSCKNRTEFHKHSWAYKRAQDFGIMDEIHKILPLKHNEWDYEIVREIAKQYKHRVDFKKGNNSAWQWASKKRNNRREFYEEITSHMTPKGTWYKKLVYRYDFPNNTVYFGITNDPQQRINSHKEKGAVYEYSQAYGLTPVYTEITDYIDKNEARDLEKSLISEYRSLGWNVLNKTNGGENGGGEEYITKELCHQEALKYKYRWEFGEGSPVFYQKAGKRKWMEEICAHMDDKFIHWDEEKILDVAKNSGLTLITEFARMYSGAYQAAKHLGIKQKLRDIFEWKGGKFWTKEEIWEIAKKYTVRSLFIEENPASSNYAQRKGWYDEITSHMGYLPKGKKWTKEECHIEALKYETRTQFARASDNKGCNKAYQAASHNGWLDEICSHMTVAKRGKIGKRNIQTT